MLYGLFYFCWMLVRGAFQWLSRTTNLGAVAATCVFVQFSIAANPTSDFPNADQILVVSTRGYPTTIGQSLDFGRTQGQEVTFEGRATGNTADLRDTRSNRETWVFVHGNQIPATDAIRRGLLVYSRLSACRSVNDPVRFVIWSWPSERTSGRIRDASEKKVRTDVESFLLGSYLSEVAPTNAISLIGYSFGARVIGGALHLHAGGCLEGRSLRNVSAPQQPFRVGFMAAALESDAFASCGRNCLGLRHVEKLRLMNNSRDKVLNLFWLLDRSHPHAMGDVGLSCANSGALVQQCDWAKSIGRDHSLMEYLNRTVIMQGLSDTLSR